jgi:predicted O-methyltransferase YrrM
MGDQEGITFGAETMLQEVRSKLTKFLDYQEFYCLNRNVVEINDIRALKKVFGWKEQPLLDRPDMDIYVDELDANDRRVRDAESLGAVMKNVRPRVALEIGTSDGMGTVLMAANAPDSKIFTINIPPEEVESGEGGRNTTWALERKKIGIEYRKRGFKNVKQIFANTAKWKPNIGTIDVAFIDGCHDTDFVYNDSVKVLKHMKKGSFILWHDFNMQFVNRYEWINEVCLGVEKLYRDGLLKGKIFHMRDSLVGIHRVG